MTDAERPFIREALQSVQNQTMIPYETIIVVLESNTWIDDVVAEFSHMKVMRRPPGWEGAARHTAIDVAQTEFVAFLDGDDVWLPAKTSRQVELMRRDCWDLVGADYIMTTEEGKPFAYGLCRYQAPPSKWATR
jgi:glycosyltransferase involved in cell wall biosynthesis